ncbi:flagellar biosynthesis anti-sigma factor FlgM [Vibrio sp. ZSDE26]|uniref:Negative regulator of flagellin synthesis n=1 Tax=Vibrio amylolyticus TaxID=2847292 RepID=A0A9X2BJD5_9VIBR|nr:flagellar biosynthesis anti-sigma factor FlgM [Vibrio amylolyticus]MCK6263362.1 flagellar biosynthesis anti-sigma factor FlgM [Vibrio amylolyticus]
MINIGNNGNHTVFNQTVKPSTQAESSAKKSNVGETEVSVKETLTLEQKVSQEARTLESLQKELKQLPEVDLARVNEIRAQLLQGDYNINLDELAGAIKSTHQRD